VADGGDSLRIRRIAENISNKHSWRADKGWLSVLRIKQEANNPHSNKETFYKILHRTLAFGKIFFLFMGVKIVF
jgi:hypothetical protein